MQNIRIIMARKYISESDKRQPTTRERRAIYYEISYYLSGGGSVTINGTEYPISAGCVRFVRPGDLVFSTVPFSCLTVNFEFAGSGELNEKQLFRSVMPYFAVRQDVGDVLSRLVDTMNSESAEDRLNKYSLLFRLLSLLCHAAAPHYTPVIESSIRYMSENLDANITLIELGERAGYSALHFRRLFLAATGRTPHDYLFEMRFNRAKELLSQTDLTIDRVAAASGFRSSANFKTMFKNKMKITPGKFRKEMNDFAR